MSDAAAAVVAGAEDTSPAHDLALLAAALERFDDVAADAVVDELLARYTVGTVLSAVVGPYLAGLGDQGARGRRRLRKSTSRVTCPAGACSALPDVGTRALGRVPCWHVRAGSFTTWA